MDRMVFNLVGKTKKKGTSFFDVPFCLLLID